MNDPIDSIKVSIYGKPSTSYMSLRSGVLSQLSDQAPSIELTEVSETSKFIDENLKRIPACKVNDRWVLPDEGDHAHFIGRVKFQISMEQQKSVFQHILVPIDLSSNSANALVYAASLAQDLNMSLSILHVIHPVQATAVDTPFSVAEQLATRQKAVDSFISEYAAEVPLLADPERFDVKTTVGLASSEILQHSLESPGTMVVMGATGADVLKKLFGSVSLSVINKAAVPVLIVPEGFSYRAIDEIKYAGALEDVDEDIALILSALMTRTNADTEVVHVQQGQEQYAAQRLAAALCRNTKKVVKAKNLAGVDVFTALNQYSVETGADLLVMARAKGNVFRGIFHKSATREMSARTHVPLLIIPQK